jgi:hypothetical protein
MTERHGGGSVSTIESVPLPNPDYAFVYAKVARHVAAADAFLIHGDDHGTRKELEAAMQAIALFEATFATVHFTIKADGN